MMIEVHLDPDRSMCDGAQTITPAELARIYRTGLAVNAAITNAEGAEDAADIVPLGLERERVALTA